MYVVGQAVGGGRRAGGQVGRWAGGQAGRQADGQAGRWAGRQRVRMVLSFAPFLSKMAAKKKNKTFENLN